jgi:hypothetical protein
VSPVSRKTTHDARRCCCPPVSSATSFVVTRLWVLALLLSGGACGGGNGGRATVFDPTGANALPVDVTSSPDLERPYPALDAANAGQEPWMGVSVLRDAVRFSRPSRWAIRDASLDPGHSFIRYVSPDAYSFAIYERDDSPGKSWPDLFAHYEADVVGNGAKAIGQRVPMATSTNQGRAYMIDRKIASKVPVLSRSREILLRSEHRVMLVQIVIGEENLSRISGELLEVLQKLEVQ